MKNNKLATMPIPKLITTMSLPVIFSMIVQALYNIVDSIFVSNINEEALTALSLSFPVQMIIVAAFVGLGTGINSLISRRLGEKDTNGAILVSEHGFVISGFLYVFVAMIGLGLSFFFFDQFTDNQAVIGYGSTYIRIVMVFSFGSIITHAGMSSLQGSGEMVKPMIAQLIGAIANMILDPIFIFGWFGLPAMGVAGAAIATVTAQILAMVFILRELLTGNNIIKPDPKHFKLQPPIIREIIKVGLPSAVMQGLGSVMLGGMNLIVAGFGDSAIAVLGVYYRLQSLVFMPLFGLSIGTMPVVGFNFGAKNKARIKEAVRFSITVGLIFMSLCLLVFQTLPTILLGFFNASPEMLTIGIPAIRTISLIFPLFSVTVIFSSSFQAMGKAHYSLMVSVIRQLIVLLPAAYLLGRLGGVTYLWYAFIIAEVTGVIIVTITFIGTYFKATHQWTTPEHS